MVDSTGEHSRHAATLSRLRQQTARLPGETVASDNPQVQLELESICVETAATYRFVKRLHATLCDMEAVRAFCRMRDAGCHEPVLLHAVATVAKLRHQPYDWARLMREALAIPAEWHPAMIAVLLSSPIAAVIATSQPAIESTRSDRPAPW